MKAWILLTLIVALGSAAHAQATCTYPRSPDAPPDGNSATKDQMIASMAGLNFLKVPANTSDTAKAAVLIASDRARMFTGTVVNATAGAALD